MSDDRGAVIPKGFGNGAYARYEGMPYAAAMGRCPIPLTADEWMAGMQPWAVMSDADLASVREYCERELETCQTPELDWLQFHYDTMLAGCLAEVQRREARARNRSQVSARLSAEWLADLKRREPLEEYVVYRGVPLRRSGGRYVGSCPFHADRSPSFTVWEGEQPHWYCFGCGRGGDLFTFIEEADRCDFLRAVQTAAEYARVDLPRLQRVVQVDR